MNEVLNDKLKYLLDFKNITEDNSKYLNLQLKIFYEIIISLEKNYNEDKTQNAYYTFILNKLNNNIKSIIMSSNFSYNESGFLELNKNLNVLLKPYKDLNIEISSSLKEMVLKKNYFYYLLLSLKKITKLSYLDRYINEYQSLKLSNFNKMYKKSYTVICPDGTKFNYFLYTKTIEDQFPYLVNICAILELIIGNYNMMNYYFNCDKSIIDEFNKKYDSVLGDLRYDEVNKKIYNCTNLINELMRRIVKEETQYKKIEYLKKLNLVIFEIYNFYLTNVLNSKDDEKIKKLNDELRILEENMLYNLDSRLHNNMEHVKILKNMKIKLSNYFNNDKKNIKNEYTIYSQDKKRSNKVIASVQPITVGNKNVIINIKDIKSVGNRILLKTNIRVIDYDTLTKKIYEGIYLSLKEIKHLFSITDLGVLTRESEVIRPAIANRLLDDNIMDIIINERNNYLGDFVYKEKDNTCVIYKNQSIIDYLGSI